MSCSQILIALAYIHYICSFNTIYSISLLVWRALLSEKIAQTIAPLLIEKTKNKTKKTLSIIEAKYDLKVLIQVEGLIKKINMNPLTQ